MCEPSPPSASLRAGAITSANMIGVRSGTRIWRGVRAVSAKRRAERVWRAAAVFISCSLSRSGGVGHAVAGEPQVDVVERRLASADRPRAHAGGVDGGDRLGGGVVVQRDGEGRADGERVVAGDALGPERAERGGRVTVVHAQLDDLLAEPVEEAPR